jgi:hypothetical protein
MTHQEAYQLELGNREKTAVEITNELEDINKALAKLKLDKEERELELIKVIGHRYEGSRSYDVGFHSVTIKTDFIYALDKKAYLNGDIFIPEEFDPILKKTTYEVNKNLFNQYEKMAPDSIRNSLNELITKKESKPNVSIKVRS